MKLLGCGFRRLMTVLVCVFLLTLLTLYYRHLDWRGRGIASVRSTGLLVDTPGCRIPDLDPYDPSVASMLWKRSPLVCKSARPPLVGLGADLTSLSVLESNLWAYGVRDKTKLKCCYRELWRRNGSNVEDLMNDAVSYSNTCVAFPVDGVLRLDVEFLRVQCKIGSKKVYVGFFALTPTKAMVERRCQPQEGVLKDLGALSVLILGIDSVSRINFHRQMPKTDNFLKELGATEMLGYNKIGDNTYPNLLAALTGLSVPEARQRCWSPESPTFDTCPFLWETFGNAGYRTVFGEDDALIGMFNYNGRRGFLRPPTDYYLRPFHVAFNKAKGSGAENHDGKLCLGDKANVDVLLDYAKQFITKTSPHPYFALFWESTVTHDMLNDPQQLDTRLHSTLSHLSTSGLLDNTLLIVMSDHGLRFGPIRQTFHGWLEERLPLLTFTLPKTFQDRYPAAMESLKTNSLRLTTPYDLHKTLSDLLEGPGLNEHPSERGQSLFLTVNETRTCQDADIPVHWCTCTRVETIPVYDDSISSAAKFVVGELNAWLRSYPQCARLEVAEVRSAARRFVSGDSGDVVDFVLVVSTLPGGALFEATVREGVQGWEFVSKGVGDVSRVNLYGEQSWCVDDATAKLFCYCLVEYKGL